MENENSIQTDELIEPREEYSISLTAKDMKNIFRLQMRKRYIKSSVLIIALAIFIPSCAYSYKDDFSIGFFTGMYLLAIVIMVINLFTVKRKWQSSADATEYTVKGEKIAYCPRVSIICDEDNKTFYSKDGKLYYRQDDTLVDGFNYAQ